LSEKEVIKHSATVQISNKISLLQRKTWNVLLANAYDELPIKDEYHVRMSDLLEILQVETRNDKHFKNIIIDLMSTVVEFNLLEKDNKNEWHATTLLSYVGIKNGVCTYEYSSFLRKILYNPAIYARIKLSMQNKFSSKHALALYELCIDYFIEKRNYGTTPFIKLEKFRNLMGIKESEYTTFKELNKWVIKRSVTEINDKTDLFVEPEYRKENRKVIAVKFSIKQNPKKKVLEASLLFQETKDDEQANNVSALVSKNELYERLQKYFCLSPPQAQEVLNTYDEKYVLENLAYVENKNKKGKIKNIGAYTIKALKEDYRNQKSQFEIDKEDAIKKQQKEKSQKELEEKQQIEYAKYKRNKADEYRKKLSHQELQLIKEECQKQAEIESEGNEFLFKFLMRTKMEDYLAQKTGVLPFEEWQKLNIS
jgi:plasmid replication initiation protein